MKRTIAAMAFVIWTCLAANSDAQSAASSQADALHAQPCPMSGVSMPVTPGAPPPRIPIATSVAAVDTSTSIVIRPDPADQIACRKDAMQAISDVVFATRALPDGKSMNLRMDVQIPMPRGKRHPLVIYVPGGGFMMAQKEQALNLRTYVADAGFVVATVQYRTMLNGATFRDSVADVKSAIRFLRANALKYDIDAGRVAVWGESAGGYLVAMVGVTNGVKSFDVGNDLDRNSDVQAVVDKFGPSDVSKIAADFEPQLQEAYWVNNPFLPYLEGKVTTAANPLTYIKATAPPFLIFHGSQDRLVSPSQTLLLHNSLVAAGVRSTRYVLEGAGHGDLAFMGDAAAGLPWSTRQTMGIIVDFLRATLEP